MSGTIERTSKVLEQKKDELNELKDKKGKALQAQIEERERRDAEDASRTFEINGVKKLIEEQRHLAENYAQVDVAAAAAETKKLQAELAAETEKVREGSARTKAM